MDKYKNLYELRKTIRFELKPKEIKRPYHPVNDCNNLREMIADLIDKYNHVIQNLEGLVYFKPEEGGGKELNKKVSIKHSWLRTYTKEDFYDAKDKIVQFNKKDNKVSIGNTNVGFLGDYLTSWIGENKSCIDELQEYLYKPREDQTPRSELAYWVRLLKKRSNFESIFGLFNGNIEHKDGNELINVTKDILGNCKILLLNLEKELLPSQSLGLEIERASLNYYTVNKKPINYAKEIQDKKNELQETYDFPLDKVKLLNKVGFFETSLSIKELKEAMKVFKAKQKSRFHEFVAQHNNYQALKTEPELELLNDITECNFNKFRNTSNKQKRGKHFQFNFSNYKKFCNIYKEVAKTHGDINAQIKALEKEKIDAERVQSWAVLLDKDNQKYVLTIPRDAEQNLPDAKKFVDRLKPQNDGKWKLYSFESLTLRALNKLCFGLDKNTFIPVIISEIKLKEPTFFIEDKLKRKDQFSEDGGELLKFYQTVLSLDSTRTVLAVNNFSNFSQLCTKAYRKMKEFEKELKQTCYYKKEITVSEKTLNFLIDNFKGNLYKITSYDLEKNDQEEIVKLDHKKQFDRNNPENHTKIWLDFWTEENILNEYKVRLNPEFKINFVEKRINELQNKNLGELKKNRKLNERYLLSTTITLQAHDKSSSLSFKTTDEIVKSIEEYNKEFNQKIEPYDIYYYGLDRGKEELLTLGVFKFSKTDRVTFTKEGGKKGTYAKPKALDLDVYRIKVNKYLCKNTKGCVAYKSIDQFIDNFDVVEKITIQSCFDLSCTKLVKGKIVINGDIATYLELKRVSALRKIWEGGTKNKFKSKNICLDKSKNALFLKIENKGKLINENLYFYDDGFSNILSLDSIKKELQSYLNKVQSKNSSIKIPSIDKVNHLRDALCANTVGIINHLQQKYFGIIVFENLNTDNKNYHISKLSDNIESRIEIKLLQKFQTLLLVPPNLKQIKNLQSEKRIQQLGIVYYINTRGTSSACPHCETLNSDKSTKLNNHAYKCKNKNCNFNTEVKSERKGLDFLDNSDKVAAYNIAKRGLSLLAKNKIN